MAESGSITPVATAGEQLSTPRRWLIRTRAYFRKEVNELRRQPLLILSLVGGPLLVLILFGATFQSSNPNLRTIVVTPPGGMPGISEAEIRRLAGTNFTIVDVTENRAGAEELLRKGDIDVVQVLPSAALETIRRGETPLIEFESNALDPLTEGWVQYLAYALVNEINKTLLARQTAEAQDQAINVRIEVEGARTLLGSLEGSLNQVDQQRARERLRTTREGLIALEELLPSLGIFSGSGLDLDALRDNLDRAINGIANIEELLAEGALDQQLDDLRETQRHLSQLEGVIDVFVTIPPDQIVAPLRHSYSNLRGAAYPAVIFYSPAVVALLVQHTAITLGALALVRERLLGAFEVFRVAPVQMTQLLIGKYLGYTLVIALTAALLVLVLRLLGMPLLGGILPFVGLLLLLIVAALGIGFVISAVSGTDSQAIQLAMITLLISIFFSGLFITRDSFSPAAGFISLIIPMTHGVEGFRDLMLRGVTPEPVNWLALTAIALVSFVLVVVLTGRQLRRA